jgi:CRISPR-associated endonuclease/helicase Cas3
VIYAIPYTSIIEQTADVFRTALAEAGDIVVEHHSAADVPSRNAADEPIGPERLHLATENWELVVTTTVQLFESLFANRPSRCRKLHNLARSVIVLDEVQALPVDRLAPCLAALQELVTRYGATVLMCSATLPAFDQAPGLKIRLPAAHAIVADTPELRKTFSRVRVISELGEKLDDESLAKRLAEREQVLCIVDARKHAVDLFEMLPEDDARFHLSAGMCPAHRRAVLAQVKDRLAQRQPCRLVATRVIEAGVDVDFPSVWRSLAGIDSLAQAAGRCNRNDELQNGEFVVFEPVRKDAIPKTLVDLHLRRTVACETLQMHGNPLLPEPWTTSSSACSRFRRTRRTRTDVSPS